MESIDKRHKKGYVLSLAVVTILLVLSILAVQIITYKYSEHSTLREHVFADKVGFIIDDVLMDVKKVLSFSQPANSSIITIFENYSYSKSSFLSNEQARLNEFANLTGVNISFIPPSPSSIMNISFTNGMVYVTNETDANNKEIRIYNSTGSILHIDGYEIRIIGTQNKNILPVSVSSGSLHVRILSFNIQSGQTGIEDRYVDGNELNIWRINAPSAGQNVTILIGNISGKSNSLNIRQYSTNSISYVQLNISKNNKDDEEGYYNIFLNVSTSNSFYSDYLKIR